MWLSPNQNEVTRPTPARTRARWRSTEVENRNAIEVRRQWMAVIGCNQEEIDEACNTAVDLDLVDELEELAAAINLAKVNAVR